MTPISVSVAFLGLMTAIPVTHPIATNSVTCDTDFSDLTYSITPVICPQNCWRQHPRNRLCGFKKYSGGSICLAAMQLGLIDHVGGVVTVYKNMNVSFKPVGGFSDAVTSHNCSRSKVSYTFDITCDTNGNAMQAVNEACCPPKCGGGLVLGSDPYNVNSSVCSAAVHAGKVTKEHGGDVTFYNFKDVLNISGLVGNGVVGASGSSVEIFTFKLVNECKLPTKACDNNATCSDDLCGFRCACTLGFKGKLCDRGIEDCYAGVKDGRVNNLQMTASSFHNSYGPPRDGRLDGDGSWVTLRYDTNEWLQVDFLANKTIYGVVTQGGGRKRSWVSNFEINYSNNGKNFTSIGKTFDGNVDQYTHKINRFPHPFTARYFRLVVVKPMYRLAFLRLEYLTC